MQDHRSNMDTHQNVLYAAGLPALISTGITLIYFLLKACRFAFYALSHKTEGRLAAATPGHCQQEHRSVEGEKGHTEVYEQVSGDNTEQYGTGAQRPSGSLLVPRRRQDLRLSSRGDVTKYPEKPAFRQNEKRLPGGRSGSTTNYYGEGPSSTYDDSPGVFTESGGWTNAADGQPSDDARTGGKEGRDKDPYVAVPPTETTVTPDVKGRQETLSPTPQVPQTVRSAIELTGKDFEPSEQRIIDKWGEVDLQLSNHRDWQQPNSRLRQDICDLLPLLYQSGFNTEGFPTLEDYLYQTVGTLPCQSLLRLA